MALQFPVCLEWINTQSLQEFFQVDKNPPLHSMNDVPWRLSRYVDTLSESLRLLWVNADPYAKRRLVIALVLAFSTALATALTPIALKSSIDGLAGSAGDEATVNPVVFVIIYILGDFLTRCLYELQELVHGQAAERVQRHVRSSLFQHLIALPMRFHSNRKTGAIGETVEQGVEGNQLLLHHIVFTAVLFTVQSVTIFIVLFHFDKTQYIVIIAGSSVLLIAAFLRGAAAINLPSQDISAAKINAQSVLADSLLNCEAVKVFGGDGLVSRRYDSAVTGTEVAWHVFFRRRAANGVAVATIISLSLGLCVILAARDVMHGTMTIGEFALINAYVLQLAQPLQLLGFAIRDVAQGLGFLQKMLDLFREKKEEGSPSTLPFPQNPLGSLRFDNVSFSYDGERLVVNQATFHVSAGKTVAVVGNSGSGKSSLICLLFRLYEPDAGAIFLDGEPISQMPLSDIRTAIAIVPQDVVLFHDTIAANIAFGRDDATQGQIEEAARLANLDEFICQLPDGYDTIVGERGIKLSGGERQRVAIARATLKKAHIYVFDEATSSLDSETERHILRNIKEVASRATTLVVAHRLSTIAHADEILVMHDGTIVERGTHLELQAKESFYAALWNAQQDNTQ